MHWSDGEDSDLKTWNSKIHPILQGEFVELTCIWTLELLSTKTQTVTYLSINTLNTQSWELKDGPFIKMNYFHVYVIASS